MKTANTLGLISSLILAAGCTDDTRQTRYGSEPTYSGPVASPTYGTTYPSGPATRPPTYPTASTTRVNPPYTTTTQGSAAGSQVISAGTTQVISATDASLATEVRQQMNRYGELAAAAQNIQITARNGNVTLSGYVPNQRDRQMIQAVARSTPGVASVNDQLQISNRPLATSGQTDQALATQLQQALSNHPTLGAIASSIVSTVQNGRVTLTGTVPSEQDRTMVQEVVKNIAGVVSVTDQMQIASVPTGRVSQPARVYPSAAAADMINLHVQGLSEGDRMLAQRILDGLRTETAFAAPQQPIDINVANGQVTLQGAVQTYEQKRDIAAAIQRAAGVNTVYDDLQVVKSP